MFLPPITKKHTYMKTADLFLTFCNVELCVTVGYHIDEQVEWVGEGNNPNKSWQETIYFFVIDGIHVLTDEDYTDNKWSCDDLNNLSMTVAPSKLISVYNYVEKLALDALEEEYSHQLKEGYDYE